MERTQKQIKQSLKNAAVSTLITILTGLITLLGWVLGIWNEMTLKYLALGLIGITAIMTIFIISFVISLIASRDK